MRCNLLCLLVLIVIVGTVLARPKIQRIIFNNHAWEVPNEPGWDEVIRDVELVQYSLRRCTSAAECHRIINQLRAVFDRHAVSRKYIAKHVGKGKDFVGSIFKWG